MTPAFEEDGKAKPDGRDGRAAMLEGVRILDLSCFFSGPLCGYLLAQMGATVVKIETPGVGDPARRLGLSSALSEELMGAAYLAANGGKKSVTLNLKSEEGRAIFLRLVGENDVVLENFRPGVMERLGLGHRELARHRPDLVYCAISGFGQTGPLHSAPAFDQIIQGMSGVMSITGQPDGGPQRVGYPIADAMAGIFAALSVVGALHRRAHDSQGEMLDVSMLDSVIASMGWAVSNYLVAGIAPRKMGNDNFTSSPSGTFAAADGSLNIAINTDEQYERLTRALNRPDLLDDARFSAREARKTHRTALTVEVERALAARTVDEWVDILSNAGVPAGQVLELPQVFAHAQVRHRDLIQVFPGFPTPTGDLRVLRPGFKSSAGPLGVTSPPRRLGADTDEVLGGLGYGTNEIAALRRAGVV